MLGAFERLLVLSLLLGLLLVDEGDPCLVKLLELGVEGYLLGFDARLLFLGGLSLGGERARAWVLRGKRGAGRVGARVGTATAAHAAPACPLLLL